VAATFVGTAFVSRVPIAIVAALAAAVGAFVPRARPLLALTAAVLLVLARTGTHPGLGWYALAFFAVAVATGALGRGEDARFDGDEPDAREVLTSEP